MLDIFFLWFWGTLRHKEVWKKCFFRWGTQLYVSVSVSPSVCLSVCPSVRPSVRHAPYLKNRTSSNDSFYYTCVEWWYLQAFVSFLWNFYFLGCKRAKIAQNEKSQLHPSRTKSQEQYSLWSWFLVHLCKMMISLGVFFFFIYINFHFSDCYWVKRAKKWTKMTKKFCRLYFKSHKTYIIWLSFMVLLCKMMISPGVFFHFFKLLILILWVFRGGGGG